jgi:poly(3-hydroxyalkanoate) depolymerase
LTENEPEIHHIRSGRIRFKTAIWHGADEGEGQSKSVPLFVFNGIGANLELLAPLADHLTGRTIIAFDAPGVGGSEESSLPYRPWMLARHARNILNELDIEAVDAMGISWGGAMAQQFAFQYPKRVRRLVLVATSAGVLMVPGRLGSIAKMVNPRRYVDPSFMLKNFTKLYGDDMRIADDHTSRLTAPTLRSYLYQLTAGAGWTSVPFLPFLKQPTLVMSGDRDSIVPAVNGRFLAKLIPNSQMEVIEGGHLFLLSNPEAAIPKVRAFLEQAV